MQSLYPYTPRKAKFEHLKKTFVAREDLFKKITDSIKAQAHSEAFQHWMILGTRGMGKSHLITMIYHTIKTDDSLNDLWTPVLMNEEEQSIFSLHTLFLRILIQLSDEIKTANEKKAAEIISFVDAFRSGKESREEILESALAFLKDFMENSGKKLLLLLENTDEIFTRYLTSKKEIKKFRSILTHENFLLMIGTSPTFFDGISNVKAPLYDFFRLRQLHLLTYQEAVQLLNCWLEMDRQTEKLDKCPLPFKEDDYRLRVLFHLTGGNPRILLFLYMAVNGKDGIDNALDTFTALLEEDLSNYYLSRIRDLSNQVQPIVIALAESNRNLTQTQIAQKTFLPVRSMGTAINRLEKDGMIKPVSEKKGKNTLYTLTDQLFRLWHQWRTSLDDRKVITALVEFLAVWYRRKDLVTYSMKKDITGLHCLEALDYRKTDQFKSLWQPFHVGAKARIDDLLVKEDYTGLFENLALLEETGYKTGIIFDKSIKKLGEENKLDTAIERLQEQLSKKPNDTQLLKDLGKIFIHGKDSKAAENNFKKVLEIDPEDEEVLYRLGRIYLESEEFQNAERILTQAVKIFPENILILSVLGLSFLWQEKYAKAEKAIIKVSELGLNDPYVWELLGYIRICQKNYKSAEEAYLKAIELDSNNQKVWKQLFEIYNETNNYQKAEEAILEALNIDPLDTTAWLKLSNLRVACKNYKGAQESIKNYLKLVPKDKDALYLLSYTQYQQQNYIDAENSILNAIKTDPIQAEFWRLLTIIYWAQDKWEAAENALFRELKLAPLERMPYFLLFSFCLSKNEFNPIIKKLNSTTKLKEADNRFKSTRHFLLALSYRFKGDQTPFLSNLKTGLNLLEKISDEERQEVLIKIIDFLVDILDKNTVQELSEFIKTMNQIPSAITEVLRPLLHVVEYFEAFYSDSKNKKEPMAKAQRVLDSITDEIREPVEEMIERVKSYDKQ